MSGPARTPLSGEQWRRIERVFSAVVDRPDWEAATRQMCEGDADLEKQVRRLVRAGQRERAEQTAAALIQSTKFQGRELGHWRLERLIGRGGMGAVFLGSRTDGQFDQQVAIKLMAFAMQSPYVVERFRLERAALARLNHPNIARLLDGGVTDQGEPFLVLEFVDGKPLEQHCKEANAPIEERIRLFQQVCRAVHFAHQNLIVHCDLKPSNIVLDRSGVPKLLDFGTAKLLAEGQESTLTGTGLMTPGYASPEQLRGEAVGTPSDLYSLGIVLFELLSGQRAFPRMQGALYHPERRPIEPSAAARKAGDSALTAKLRGDLDNIVMRAMALEPAQRYGSSEELSQDLERYLRGQPVIAKPRGWTYVMAKFVGRNPVSCGLAAALTITVMVGGLMLLRRDRAARVEARNTAELAGLASGMLRDLSADNSPMMRNLSVQDLRVMLEKFRSQMDNQITQAPGVKAGLLFQLGQAFWQAKEADEGMRLWKEAAAILESSGNPDPYQLAGIDLGLSASHTGLGEFGEAWRRANLASKLLDGAPPDHPLRLGLLMRLGLLLYVTGGEKSETERTLAEALSGAESRYGSRSLPVARAMDDLARAQISHGKLVEAERHLADAEAIVRAEPNARAELVTTLTLRGILWRIQGRLVDAKRVLLEATSMTEAWQPAVTVHVRLELARVEALSGRAVQAIPAMQDALANYRQAHAAWETAYTLTSLGQALTLARRPVEAETVLRESLAMRRRSLPAGHRWTLDTEGELGAALLAKHECVESKQLLEESYRGLAGDLGPQHSYAVRQEQRIAEWRKVCAAPNR